MTKMEAQPIPEANLTTILKLHQRRLGWSFLLESTIADRVVGFPCEAEELFIRGELKKAFNKVAAWFRQMGRQNNWPSMEGWMWEVDFSSGQAFPKKQHSQADKPSQEQDDSECRLVTEGPIMTLGDIDVDVIKRLLEKREASADSVRSHLRLFLNGEFTIDKLQGLVQELGAASMDVNDWFSEMADKYQWPRPMSDKWLYRVDIEERQVLLEPK